MAKMATGQADNLLIATYLSSKCQVAFAPAMDLDMYSHPSTQKNISVLQSYGNILIEPAVGELASKLFGKGRLREPEEIFEEVIRIFTSSGEKKN
jgi:phosphopantothenoylcysteine decarboxylase/phosphopantothenate--cysteine ligase